MPTAAPHTGRARIIGVALGLATAAALSSLTACTSGGAPTSAPAAQVVVPGSTPAGTTGSAAGPAPSAPGSSSPSGPTGTSGTTGPSAGSQTTAAGSTQGAGGLPTCRAAQMSVRVEAVEGGGAAGSQQLTLRATNTGTSACVTQGYPGVSLVAPGTGAQLGAPADRSSADASPSGPVVRLEPGRSAVAQILVGRADNFGATCAPTQAAGFRVYLPGATAAAYAPYAIGACSAASVHQLRIQPLTS